MTHASSRSARRFAPLLFLPCLAAFAGATPVRAQGITDSPRYLAFVDDNAFTTDRHRSPKLTLAIGGASTRAVMDTGSTGVVVSLADMFPDWRSQPDIVAAIDAVLPPGRNSSSAGTIDTTALEFGKMKSITYSSSGRIMYGVYIDRAITVSGAASATGVVRSVTSAKVPVLAVIDEECLPKARSCTPNHAPTEIGMIGIGFGRAAPGDQDGTHGFNPFLNLETPSAVNGYIVTATGVKIGLDANDLAAHSSTLAVLGRDPQMPGEWLPQQASISLDGRPAAVGNMLLDTGIDTMLMTVPSSMSDGLRIAAPPPSDPSARPSTDTTLPEGTGVTIALSGSAGLPVGYSFTAGRTGGMAPASMTLVGNDGSRPDWKATFVNTGVRFLNGFDYLFDDTDGLVGFWPRAQNAQ